MLDDEALRNYLTTADETLSSRHLECLLNSHALPIVTAIVEARMRVSLRRQEGRAQTQTEQDADDLRARVLGDLTERLGALRNGPSSQTITDLRAYVAMTTYRAFGRHLAGRYRSRTALREQVEYLLTHRKEFACWVQKPQRRLCGLAPWCDLRTPAASPDRLQALRADPNACLRELIPANDQADDLPLQELITTVFEWLGG